jgi:hypothetical protein
MTQDKPTSQDAAQDVEARKRKATQEDVEARKQKATQAVEARRQQARDAAQDVDGAVRKQKAAQEDVEMRKQKAAQAAEARRQQTTQDADVEANNQKAAAPRTAEKTTRPEAQRSQPPASLVTKVAQATTQILTSVFNTVKKPIVGSKVYTQNKAKLNSGWKRVQPVVKLVQWLWKQILKPFWVRVVQPLWAKVLGLLRPRLPEPLKALSDRILTVIIVGPLVLVWWLISSLTSAAPVAQVPPTQPVVRAPVAQPQKPASEAPVAPKIVEPVEPVPMEPEEPQKVVLSVQQQVAQISDRYSTDLIPQVQADFEADRLVVQVSDRWYTLGSTEQDELGLDVLKRSDGLDFKTLEIRDTQGQLVARNPIVGPHIIVLQRRQI